MLRTLARAAALVLPVALAIAACDSSGTVVLPSVKCSSTAAPAGAAPMDRFALGEVAVHVEGASSQLDFVRADMTAYLSKLWSGPITVSTASPDFTKRLTVWLSTSADAKARAGVSPADGYAIKRVDTAAGTLVVVTAPDAANLAFGAYALLEELGARFFHPMQELVPTFDAPRIPASLDVARAPAFASRGVQIHSLHPIEFMPSLNVPSDAHLSEAKRLVDWLVKTGQNYFQWVLLGESSVPFAPFQTHAQAIVDYAHARGVTVGASFQLWGGAALQNNYVLVSDAGKWQSQMEAKLDRVMGVQWDALDVQLGEFISSDPHQIVDWLSHFTAYVLGKRPELLVNVENHVGNYPNLYVMYDGQPVFYYHLPQFADSRLGQNVHTLSLFDVYRNWATYKHPDFHLQHDYLMKMLPTGRRVKYHPESAYWISADVDVPLFLPEFLYSRWLDLHELVSEARANGLPPLYGHLMFSSGHEWGYWLTDYLTAKMLWEPDLPLDAFVARWSGGYGECAGDFATALSSLIAIQTKYVFDARLLPYLQGESSVVDLGYLAGLETHPRRVQFEEVLAMNDADRASFQSAVVDALDAMATEMQPIEDAVAARCRGADAAIEPWCAELWDGVAIVRNRAQHAARVYGAVLARAHGGDAEAPYRAALALHDEARAIVARREPRYRFDLDRLTGDYANPTVYGFGYLRPAHTTCYWERREVQVRTILDEGVAPGIAGLPTCAD